MTRTQVAVFTGVSTLILIVIMVALYRLLDWLFSPQPWLWAIAILVPLAVGVFTYTFDAITERRPDVQPPQ